MKHQPCERYFDAQIISLYRGWENATHRRTLQNVQHSSLDTGYGKYEDEVCIQGWRFASKQPMDK